VRLRQTIELRDSTELYRSGSEAIPA
jgi:hypothetical protein